MDDQSRVVVWWSVLLMVVCASASAAAPEAAGHGFAISVKPDHPEGIYRAGEAVAFEIRVTQDGEPVATGQVQYAVRVNEVVRGEAGVAEIEAGTAVVRTQLPAPGCLSLKATFRLPDGKTIGAEAGAVVEPSGIRPSLWEPADFDEFWAGQKAKLAKSPAAPRLSPTAPFATEWGARVETWDVTIECPGWRALNGYFARPKDAAPRSLPAILWLHGAGFRSSRRSRAASWASRGMLALDINAHGLPNGRPAEYYREMAAGELKDYRAQGIEARETFYFLGMYLRMVRAIDFLCAQPEWDGRTLIAAGSSQGGGQALVAAGLDERVSVVAANVPGFCDLTGYAAERGSGWPMGQNLKTLERIATLRYFDACNFCARSKARTVVRVGLIDGTCPPTGVLAAYNRLKGSKHLIVEPLRGHHYVDPMEMDRVSDFVNETRGRAKP